MELPEVLTKYRSEINEEIKSVVDGRRLPLYDMMRYHLGLADSQGKPLSAAGGKAIRPALCLFACESAGKSYNKALPAAVALELIHNFTLIHDDIQDDDRERRHRPTVWAIWGKPQAINAGSAMHLLANSAMQRLQNDGISASKILRLNNRLHEITLSIIEGQYLDISFENRFDITQDDYMAMIEKKTASLISGAMEIGAIIGSDDDSFISAFGRIGLKIGLAFQIMDDLLGIWGNNRETGKPTGNDIRRRKKSFPVVYSLENAGETERKELIRIYGKTTDINEADVSKVLGIFEQSGIHAIGGKMVVELCEKAASEFNGLPVSADSKEKMHQLVSFFTGRTY